jgi:hypothetical protein
LAAAWLVEHPEIRVTPPEMPSVTPPKKDKDPPPKKDEDP